MKDLDWGSLTFGYVPTNYNVRCYYHNGKWGEIEVSSDEYVPIHMASTCLHYGQEAFEGLKAYRCPDGKVRVFRPEENAARLQSTCRGIVMPELPTDLFVEMVEKVVRLNQDFIPPYESGATLYLRPLLVGTSAQVGVHEGQDYIFLIFATPVGPYFKGGFSTNAYAITREFDRAAPFGTGKYKVGGNYAASLRAHKIAKEKGYASEFYLDAKEKKYVDECGAANFLWYQGEHLHHAEVFFHPPQHHQQELDADCRGFGPEGGASPHPRRGACYLRGGWRLRYRRCYLSDLSSRRYRRG